MFEFEMACKDKTTSEPFVVQIRERVKSNLPYFIMTNKKLEIITLLPKRRR